jgi:phosphoribosylformylglycinamidine (FGAM) synthase-like enzyme
LLYSESNGRLVIEVEPDDAEQLETLLASVPLTRIGTVTATPTFEVSVDGEPQLNVAVDQLVSAWLRQPAGVAI